MDGNGIDVWKGSTTDIGVVGLFCTIDLLKKDSEIKIAIDCSDEELTEIEKVINSEYMQCLFIRKDS